MTTAATQIEARWTPTARQLEVLQVIAAAPEGSTILIGYGGAAGGAKTNLDANLALSLAMQCPGSRTLVGRQDFVDLKATTLAEFDRSCPPGIVKRYDSAPVYREIRMPDWPEGVTSRVYFRGLEDWQSLLSEEFGFVIVDEAQEVPITAIMGLLTRLRHRPEKKWGIIASFNPFPSWCVDWFMHGSLPRDIALDERVIVRYVRSLMDDNPHLREGYKEMLLATLDPYMRAVMVEGRAEVVPNAIFAPELEANRHYFLADPVGLTFTREGAGVDWGTTLQHQSAMVFGGRAKDGRVWLLKAHMSARGSSNELADWAGDWRGPVDNPRHKLSFIRYDASQGSLKDELMPYSGDVDRGWRDVDGRIRVMRGLIDRRSVLFNRNDPGIMQLWKQMCFYHRDDDGKIVEEHDDLVDACLYFTSEMEGKRPAQMPASQRLTYAPRRASGMVRV